MSNFEIFTRLGFNHIVDVNGADHILFILSLVLVYNFTKWRLLLLLLTAFTIGHSLTLALSVLDLIVFNSKIVELCIALSIVFSAVFHFVYEDKSGENFIWLYILALLFGLIHGAGFSNYLKALLMKEDILEPLLFFNIGLEIGQILIASIGLLLTFILDKFIADYKTIVIKVLLVAIGLLASIWVIERVGNLIS